MNETGSDRPVRDVLAELRARYPDSPFLALGQTVFWDEPVKAVLRRLLDTNGLGGEMVVGVHDTDYFAKTRVRKSGQGRFALLAHNDGTTRDLWSAAGEISTLFGSETFPRRHDYVKYGAAFEKVASASPLGRQAFLDEMTEAWGWRGLVYTGSRDLIVHNLSLREVGDGVMEMLGWGFENAVRQVHAGCCQGEASKVAETITDWCSDYRAANPDKSLSDLYQHLIPRFYELLLGQTPENITVGCTAHLLRLTPETASLPRFRFVNLFLNPATRPLAEEAYNKAVAGSEIYTLDKFGAGALPFDVIVPKQGRGTLRVTPRVLFVETRQPIAIGLKKPIESIQELAEILSAKLGDHVTLVGKAVSLVSMLAQEFIFVFNEEGSMYVWRTRQMNDMLAKNGISLDMRPILRMRYNTWDSMAVGSATLNPTAHLASTFGQPAITMPEFASSWRSVVVEQRELCNTIAALKKPLELLHFLQQRDPVAPWEERRAAYKQAKATLLQLREQAAQIQAEVVGLYEHRRALKARESELQHAKGAHFRSITDWTPDALATREKFDVEIGAVEQEKRAVCAEIVAHKERRWKIERGAEATAARTTLQEVEDAAELARLHLIRNAVLTIEGLTHTNHRPSAWWLPMLDSSGEWFRRIVDTTEVYTEPLLTAPR